MHCVLIQGEKNTAVAGTFVVGICSNIVVIDGIFCIFGHVLPVDFVVTELHVVVCAAGLDAIYTAADRNAAEAVGVKAGTAEVGVLVQTVEDFVANQVLVGTAVIGIAIFVSGPGHFWLEHVPTNCILFLQ